MFDNEKLISVIIPVYNPGKYLIKCLDSIVNQTYRNLEIILIDDGSTDNSLSVCREYASRDERIIVFHQENAGVSAARNRGMDAAHGDFYSFIDSDDYLETDAYEYLINVWRKERTDIVCFEYFVTCQNTDNAHLSQAKSHYGRKNRHEAMKEQMAGVPFACVKLFTKKTVENLRFTVGLARGEDGEFVRFAIHNSDSVYYCNRPLLHYVQSEESAVRGGFRANQLSNLDVFDKSDSFFRDNYPELRAVFRVRHLHFCVSLYCDMYADASDWKEERKRVFQCFCRVKKTIAAKDTNFKTKVKFFLFRMAPNLFAKIHVD